MYIYVFRSVTLVGESGRKVLKEVIKQAKCPVKSRVMAQVVVLKYKDKIKHLEKEVKLIMKQEEEEKQASFFLYIMLCNCIHTYNCMYLGQWRIVELLHVHVNVVHYVSCTPCI